MSQGSLTTRIRFLGQKVCSVARGHTHTDTHGCENRGHPFRVSRIFPPTYHQGSVQLTNLVCRICVSSGGFPHPLACFPIHIEKSLQRMFFVNIPRKSSQQYPDKGPLTRQGRRNGALDEVLSRWRGWWSLCRGRGCEGRLLVCVHILGEEKSFWWFLLPQLLENDLEMTHVDF